MISPSATKPQFGTEHVHYSEVAVTSLNLDRICITIDDASLVGAIDIGQTVSVFSRDEPRGRCVTVIWHDGTQFAGTALIQRPRENMLHGHLIELGQVRLGIGIRTEYGTFDVFGRCITK